MNKTNYIQVLAYAVGRMSSHHKTQDLTSLCSNWYHNVAKEKIETKTCSELRRVYASDVGYRMAKI